MKSTLKLIGEALLLIIGFLGWNNYVNYKENQKDAKAITKIKEKVCNESIGCSVDGLNNDLS